MNSPTVVVVGAGPTGLATAVGLRLAGVSVRLLDKAPGPAATSRALGLQPRGAEVLDRLGALADLPERSVRIGQVLTHVDGKPLARLRVGQPTKLVTRPGLLISQADVEARLRARLATLGVDVEWGSELLGAGQDGERVRLRLADREIHSDWLVGCDGAHSRVRKAAGIAFPGVPVVERFLLADVTAKLPVPRDTVAVWLRGDRMLGAFPLPGEDLWRLMAPAPAGTDDDPLPVLCDLLAQEAGITSPVVREAHWTSTFRIHRRLASTYRKGRILLAGDAAHIHSPFGGQGMNTGLGDAENLAWKLALVATGRAGEGMLDTYEAERRPVAAEVLKSTSAMTGMLLGRTRWARTLRDHVFVPLLGRPLVQRLLWEKSSQLTLTYRTGPLGGAPYGRGPRPGDRVPDLACTRADGTSTRLYGELPARWVLLIPGGGMAGEWEAVAGRHLGAGSVATLRAPGAHRGDSVLVRPDGHLTWRGASSADLDQALTRILVNGRQ
ncbi:FAD-dependent oxidoreductase [Streptomyces antarcticus]|uniref:FAD-dependent oxidoreductase n=1 Tax=Streptomyces antarcticus TaxID=2996458 RepID=UPI0022702DB4|nr:MULTISPECIES: FAD-dependent oxidoreductase [unclassified Streptomyces]MCY0941419.1 FAD-dependent monooxygenase [Streptomyces sp. H34-AA3]MCZ4085067.1 FAD-dependent monooxygenase [Streptomyces sp. H34-S5]